MKNGLKLIIFWFTSLALFVSFVVVSRLFPEWLSSVPGLFTCFFLGYCGIIVVAQAFAFLEIICRQRQTAQEKSRRYRTEAESA